MFTIDKDVPLPPPRNGGKFVETLGRMEIGDSFVVPCEHIGETRVRSTLSRTAMRLKIKLAVRQIDGGLRVWRTA